MQLNEGLETLGRLAFYGSAIESIRLPSTLKKLEAEMFSGCTDLRSINIPSGVEHIEENCFKNSGIEEITLPGTIKEINEYAFWLCRSLRTVWVEEGCALDVRKYVGQNVEVHSK